MGHGPWSYTSATHAFEPLVQSVDVDAIGIGNPWAVTTIFSSNLSCIHPFCGADSRSISLANERW